jgi:hypothetical protein
VGGVFGVQSIVDSGTSKSSCLSNDVCGAMGFQRNQAARAEASVADVAIPAGLVAAGAGLYLLLSSRSAATPPSRAAPGSANLSGDPQARLRLIGLVPWVAPGTASVFLQSTW